MAIKEFLNKFKERKQKFQTIEEDNQIDRLVIQKQKSSNERELEKLMERDRQDAISEELKKRRRQETAQMFSGNIFKGENVFKGHKSVLHEDKSVLTNNPHSMMGRSMFFAKGGMF